MCNIPMNRKLVFDNQNYEISNSFYQLLIAETNGKDYNRCRSIVRNLLKTAKSHEIEKVREFSTKKIDFEV